MIGARGNRELFNRNLIRIFFALKDGSPLSKNDLCQRLELSRPTVDRAISQLLESGFVRQNGHGPSAGGRRALLYEIDHRARYTVGGDLGIPELNIVVSGLNGNPLVEKSLTVPDRLITNPEKTLSFVATSIQTLLTTAKIPLQRVIGIGLGVPAFLKGETITISGRNLPRWEHVPAKSILEKLLNVPVYTDNDVNFMALSENHAMGYQDKVMSYIALRRGLKNDIRMGGSTLLNGKVFHGGNGNATSLQHAYVEVQNLQKQQKEAATSASASRKLASFVASHLIGPITRIVWLFDPNRLVINAKILGAAEKAFIEEITSRLKAELSREFDWEIEVSMAQDRQFSCAKGGALFVLQKVFSRSRGLIERLITLPS